MYYYKIKAEHIGRLNISKAAEEMQQLPGTIIMTAGLDDIFEQCGVWVVATEQKLGNQLQDIVWRWNGGNWCEQIEISEDYADSMC